MKLYRFTAVISAIAIVFMLTSCVTEAEIPATQAVTDTAGETVGVQETTEVILTYAYEETTAQSTTAQSSTAQSSTAQQMTAAPETTAAADEASGWGTELVAAYYVNAAAASGSSVSSRQTIELKDISVNNGALGGVFKYVTPILSKFLSGSATEAQGITGNFQALTAEDIISARAYKASGGTVVEMTLREQSGSASENASEGSVGHAISVVGDLGSIMGQLNDAGLPLDVSIENTVITYRNPTLSVLVDDSGKIANGTWSCEVEISLRDYSFAGAAVESTVVVLQNTITVGGGFSA